MGTWITILKLNTQDTLINTLPSQVPPSIHPMNDVVEIAVAMTWDPWMSPYINNDVGEAQTNHECILILEIPTWLAQHDIDYNRTLIPIPSNTSIIPSWVKIGRNGSFHEPFSSPYLKFIHMTNHLKEEAIDSNNNGFHRKTRLWLTTYQWGHCGYWWTTKQIVKYYHNLAWDKHYKGRGTTHWRWWQWNQHYDDGEEALNDNNHREQ
jgi:hypothetical protein